MRRNLINSLIGIFQRDEGKLVFTRHGNDWLISPPGDPPIYVSERRAIRLGPKPVELRGHALDVVLELFELLRKKKSFKIRT